MEEKEIPLIPNKIDHNFYNCWLQTKKCPNPRLWVFETRPRPLVYKAKAIALRGQGQAHGFLRRGLRPMPWVFKAKAKAKAKAVGLQGQGHGPLRSMPWPWVFKVKAKATARPEQGNGSLISRPTPWVFYLPRPLAIKTKAMAVQFQGQGNWPIRPRSRP